MTKKQKLLFVIAIILIIVISFSYKYVKIVYIKKIGINLEPTKVISPIKVNYYIQNDPEWNKHTLGATQYSMGSSGCLICCIAASLQYLGINFNPGETNKIFSKYGIYNSNGEVIWYKIKEAIKNADYDYLRIFSRDTIETDLLMRHLPIVKVKYFKTGIFHWVLIVGSNEKDFLIMDPLNKKKSFIPLGTHGCVYAYRKLVKRSEGQ